MFKKLGLATLFSVSLLAGGMFVLTPKPVEFKITPQFGYEPLPVRLVIKIEPDAKNREACILYAGSETTHSSCKNLDGENQPKIEEVRMVLPNGDYEVSIVLYRNDGKVIQSDISRVKVIPKQGASDGLNHSLQVRGIS